MLVTGFKMLIFLPAQIMFRDKNWISKNCIVKITTYSFYTISKLIVDTNSSSKYCQRVSVIFHDETCTGSL